jgi:hypothetical protein
MGAIYLRPRGHFYFAKGDISILLPQRPPLPTRGAVRTGVVPDSTLDSHPRKAKQQLTDWHTTCFCQSGHVGLLQDALKSVGVRHVFLERRWIKCGIARPQQFSL